MDMSHQDAARKKKNKKVQHHHLTFLADEASLAVAGIVPPDAVFGVQVKTAFTRDGIEAF